MDGAGVAVIAADSPVRCARPGRAGKRGAGRSASVRAAGRGFGARAGRRVAAPSGRPDGAGSGRLHRRRRARPVPLPLPRRQRGALPAERPLSGIEYFSTPVHTGPPGPTPRSGSWSTTPRARRPGRRRGSPHRRAAAGRDGTRAILDLDRPPERRRPHPGRGRTRSGPPGSARCRRGARAGGGRERRVARRRRAPGRLGHGGGAARPGREAARRSQYHDARPVAGAAASVAARRDEPTCWSRRPAPG